MLMEVNEIGPSANTDFLFVLFIVTPYPKLELPYFGEPVDLLRGLTRNPTSIQLYYSFNRFLSFRKWLETNFNQRDVTCEIIYRLLDYKLFYP